MGRPAKVSPTITTIHFSPDFLEENGPKLTIFRIAAQRSSNPIARNVVINNDSRLNTVDPHFNGIDSTFVHFLCDKHVFDSCWNLSKRRKRSNVVAITNTTLFDVRVAHAIFKNFRVTPNLWGATPVIIVTVLFLIRLVKRLLSRWEVGISPLLTRV